MNVAMEINNRAARLIECDRFSEALNLLGSALELVKNQIDSESQTTTVQDANSGAGPSHDETCRKETIKRRVLQLKKLGCGDDFLYDKPIYVKNIPVNHFDYISVILIFNMALCNHLSVLETDDCVTKEVRLQSALKLYELGFQMHMKGDLYLDMTYALAMINNCALIYKVLNRQRRAQKFLTHMLSSLMIMIECGEASSLDELDGFLKNASRIILKEAVAPAA